MWVAVSFLTSFSDREVCGVCVSEAPVWCVCTPCVGVPRVVSCLSLRCVGSGTPVRACVLSEVEI